MLSKFTASWLFNPAQESNALAALGLSKSPCKVKENVMEHSFEVAVIAHGLAFNALRLFDSKVNPSEVEASVAGDGLTDGSIF